MNNYLLTKRIILVALFANIFLYSNAQARVEAETNFTVVNQAAIRQEWAGNIGLATYGGTTCSGGAYLSIAVATDEVQIPLTISVAGSYRLLIRVRTGWDTNPTYHVDKYEVRVNGTLASTSLVAGSVTTTIDVDSYYGTLTTQAMFLTSGVNLIRVKALDTWQKIDYIEAESSTPKPTLNVYQLSSEPIIDGEQDPGWSSIPWLDINQRDLLDGGGSRTPDADFGAKLKVAWRNNKLFLFYDVTDNVLFFNSALARYNQDNVAVKLNFANTHLTDINYRPTSTWYYQAAINQTTLTTGGFVAGRGGTTNTDVNNYGWPSAQNQFPSSQIITKAKTNGSGYTVEIAFDLNDTNWGLPSAFADGITFGFDAGVDDVDVQNGPRKQLYWSNLGKGNNSWDDLSGLGVATIKSSNGFTHFRSKSSGNWDDLNTWESSVDGTLWSAAFSFPNEVANEIIVANNNLVNINTNASINQLVLEPKAKLSLNTGNTLAVSALTLNSDATGTATFVDNNITPQNINATVHQYITAGRNWYISSPITNATAARLNRGTSVQSYTESTKAWSILNSSDVLVPGKGYISVASATSPGTTGTVSFTGLLNSGNITIPLTRTETGSSRGFNLVANPYPSYLDWNAVINKSENENIVTTMWFRTKNTAGNYTFATHNGTSGLTVNGTANTAISKFIPPMQAFWVRVKQNASATTYSTNMILENNMRAHSDVSTNTMKAPKISKRMLVRLAVSNTTDTDETLLYFDANAHDSFDDYDSQKMFANPSVGVPEIFTFSGFERVVINGMNRIPFDTEIPLGFISPKANQLSLRTKEMSNFEQGTKLFIKDYVNNQEFDITDGLEYSFHSETIGHSSNRFSLIFRAKELSTQNTENKMNLASVLKNNQNQIQILNSTNFTYSIHNTIGKQIESGIGIANQTRLTQVLPKGVYIVKIMLTEHEQTIKIVIQ